MSNTNTQSKQLPKRSTAKFSKSLTPKAVEVTKEFGWDFFKAGVLIADEWQPCQGEKDPETLFLLVKEAKIRNPDPNHGPDEGWIPSDQGKWNLPCGRLQPWETFEQAAHREGLEESGYDCEVADLCHVGFRFDINNPYEIRIYYSCNYTKVADPDPEEIADIGWFSYAGILGLKAEGMLRNADLVVTAVEQYRKYNREIPEGLFVNYPSKFADDTEVEADAETNTD